MASPGNKAQQESFRRPLLAQLPEFTHDVEPCPMGGRGKICPSMEELFRSWGNDESQSHAEVSEDHGEFSSPKRGSRAVRGNTVPASR